MTNTIALSDGRMMQMPTLSKSERARFLILERRLARQQKGSARRARTLNQLAVLRRRLTNRRTDWIEKTTTDLARTYDGFAIEALQIENMVRRPKPKPAPDQPGVFLPNGARAKAGLNKAIYASGWGQFATRLTHKTVVVAVPAQFSSQECRKCHHTSSENRENQADFACISCGHTNHADTNAAEIILTRGEGHLAARLAPSSMTTRGHSGGSDASDLHAATAAGRVNHPRRARARTGIPVL